MNKDSSVTQEDFEALMSWLDADRDLAGIKYEAIRLRLIKFFACRGRVDADELTDASIVRVTLKATKLAKDYVGDPILYFYGVARKVLLEEHRKLPLVALPPVDQKSEDAELVYECLDSCMLQLTEGNRELVLEYYQYDKRAKIEHRKALAEKLGVAQNALRIRAHRIRLTLEQCVKSCLKQRLST